MAADCAESLQRASCAFLFRRQEHGPTLLNCAHTLRGKLRRAVAALRRATGEQAETLWDDAPRIQECVAGAVCERLKRRHFMPTSIVGRTPTFPLSLVLIYALFRCPHVPSPRHVHELDDLRRLHSQAASGRRAADSTRPSTPRACRLGAGRSGELCGIQTARVRYAGRYYAFKPLSEIRGGVRPLLELRRRWNLPDGHKDKLRIERATREDVRNAAYNPDSVHPNPVQLAEEKKAAARKAATVVPSYTLHPGDLRLVGVDFTSTQRGTAKGNQRAQRIDTGRRRKRASDGSLQVRKRLPMRGITSMRFVLPGVDGTSDGEERAGKRARLDDYALDDPITEFELSTDFGGSLSTLDAFRTA